MAPGDNLAGVARLDEPMGGVGLYFAPDDDPRTNGSAVASQCAMGTMVAASAVSSLGAVGYFLVFADPNRRVSIWEWHRYLPSALALARLAANPSGA